MKEITQEYLKSILDYNPETGGFVWKYRTDCPKRWNTRFSGKEAGTLVNEYVCIKINSNFYKAHRLAWIYVHGTWPKNYTDHINGIRNDNRICNLREATRPEYCQNQKKAMSNNNTGFLGVSTSGKRYRARIRVNEKIKCIGTFITKKEAHEAYLQAKREHHTFCTI